MSRPAQGLHLPQLASGLRSHLIATLGHRKVKFGTCMVPLSETTIRCCCHNHRASHLRPAWRHSSYYSRKQHCTRAATHSANGENKRNNINSNDTTKNNKAPKGTKRRQSSKTSHSAPALTLFALLNLTLLAPQCREIAGAPTQASGQFDAESSIKVTRFQVPERVRPGELRRLTCLYELNGATLHAMKLFKDDKEFYRFTPSPDAPSDRKMTFPVVGVQVELNRSNEREVWLKTNKRSYGQYKCQVSIEGTFNSVSAERRMEVVDGNQMGPGSAQASSGHLAGASLWQQPQQYDTAAAQRHQLQGPSPMMSSRTKLASQRHGHQVTNGAIGRVGVSSECSQQLRELSWSLLILVSLLAQIAATKGATIALVEPKRAERANKLNPHLSHRSPFLAKRHLGAPP